MENFEFTIDGKKIPLNTFDDICRLRGELSRRRQNEDEFLKRVECRLKEKKTKSEYSELEKAVRKILCDIERERLEYAQENLLDTIFKGLTERQ